MLSSRLVVCKVDKSAKLRNLQDGWNLSELHMKTTAECSYLEQDISFFYLYHRYFMILFYSIMCRSFIQSFFQLIIIPGFFGLPSWKQACHVLNLNMLVIPNIRISSVNCLDWISFLFSACPRGGRYMLYIFLYHTQYLLWLLILFKTKNSPHHF